MGKRILIVAGEASGDRHAADLILALKDKDKNLEFVGIGGDHLQNAGVKLLHHISQLAILGFVEIIKHIPFIRQVFRDIEIEAEKGLDAAILVDYPGFNLRLAKKLKRKGIPVIYYICPQMWAWGEGRIKKFRKYVDLPLVIFKFEENFFANHGLKAHFVGHPLIDQVPKRANETEFREKYDIPFDKMIIGLFPGSREMEIKRILPVMVDSIREVQHATEIIPLVAKAPHLDIGLYNQFLPNQNGFQLIDSDIHQLMKIAYAALVASGTATLELGYVQTPSIVLYAVSPLTFWLARRLVKVDNIALANIVIGKAVFPEYIQNEANVDNIVKVLNRLLYDEQYYQNIKNETAKIKKILGPAGATDRAAEIILDFMRGNH